MNWNTINKCSQIYPQIEKSLEIYRGKSFLITGANGLLASYLTKFLLFLNTEHNFQITIYALVRNLGKAQKVFAENIDNPQLKFLVLDITDPNLGEKLALEIPSVDYILHSATNAYPAAYQKTPVEIMNSTYFGASELAKFALKKSANFMFVSSSEVYGDSRLLANDNSQKAVFSETDFAPIDPLNPRASYPESKRATETLLASYAAEYDAKIRIVRPGVVYGAIYDLNNSRADAEFLRKAANKEQIILKSDGKRSRSYIYALDCAIAFLDIWQNPANAEAFNVADDSQNISTLEFAQACTKVGSLPEIVFEIPENAEPPAYGDLLLSIQKLSNIGFKPFFSLEEGVLATITEIKQM